MRPPRRPLTAHDFPELAGASNGGRPDTGGNSAPRSIRRGFLDWMAGRNRSSARGDSPVLADRPVAGAPLSAKEDRTTSRKLPEAGDQHRAHTGYHPDGSGGEDGVPLPRQVDRRGGRGSDELFEIPEFFKKT